MQKLTNFGWTSQNICRHDVHKRGNPTEIRKKTEILTRDKTKKVLSFSTFEPIVKLQLLNDLLIVFSDTIRSQS